MPTQRYTTEDWLALLCWALSRFSQPTLNNLLQSFEEWDYRNNRNNRWQHLEQKGWIAARENGGYAFTQAGQHSAWGGLYPPAAWIFAAERLDHAGPDFRRWKGFVAQLLH